MKKAPEIPTIPKVVGQRMKEARLERGLTQAELGERLRPYLGRGWSKQAVSAAEDGRREFTAAELIAIAACLEKTLGSFFMIAPGPQGFVQFPGGYKVPAGELHSIVYGWGRPEPLPQEMRAMLRQYAERLSRQMSEASEAADIMLHLAEGIEPKAALHSPTEGDKDDHEE